MLETALSNALLTMGLSGVEIVPSASGNRNKFVQELAVGILGVGSHRPPGHGRGCACVDDVTLNDLDIARNSECPQQTVHNTVEDRGVRAVKGRALSISTGQKRLYYACQ